MGATIDCTKRVKSVEVSAELVTMLFTTGNLQAACEVIAGLPPGARFRGAYAIPTTISVEPLDIKPYAVGLTFEHESFPVVAEGEMYPILEVKVRSATPTVVRRDVFTDRLRDVADLLKAKVSGGR
jgi:hypothetical protein